VNTENGDGGNGAMQQQQSQSNKNVRKSAEIMRQGENDGAPDSLYVEWIRVEQKQRNNKIKSHCFVAPSQQQKYVISSPDMEGLANKLSNIQKEDNKFNQKSRIKFKRKMPRYENIATNNNKGLKPTQYPSDTSSMGIYAGTHCYEGESSGDKDICWRK
jgi:hypothetical protein